MKLRKTIYILGLMMFILTACGKEVAKEQEKQVESQQHEVEEHDTKDQTDKNQDDIKVDVEINEKEEEEKEEKATNVKDTSNSDTTQKPSNGSNTQKPSDDSSTQKPSNESANTNNTNNSTTKKPVKRVSEETKSAVEPYKYGITKYDVIISDYTLYSDGSKELLDSWSYTIYDSSNYSATDSQLKSEADSNASKYMNYYQEVLRLVNEIRAEVGVAPLTLDTTLCKAATMRALEMDYANNMSHTRPNGSQCFTVLDFYAVAYCSSGENIAAGYSTAASVVDGWKKSPGHYANMIDATYTKLGVGYSAMNIGEYSYYWCQLFSN